MALHTKPWDAADFLTDTESIFYYLEAALEKPTPEHVAGSLATAVRARGGLSSFAQETGVDKESLQKAISFPGELTYSVTGGVLNALRPSHTARVA